MNWELARKAKNRLRRSTIAGIVVSIAVDLLVTILIPGSSIAEGILAFIAGLSAGWGILRKYGYKMRGQVVLA